MRAYRRLVELAIVVALAASATVAQASGSAGPAALDRLRDAIAEHPSDPDLRWALARKLARDGSSTAALSATREFLSRWPDRRPGARIEIATTLLDRGLVVEASALLDEALVATPRSAMARFYRGLAFRAEGLVLEANREFRIAGRLEPALQAETLLARALGLFDLGRDDEAIALLREILQTDPTGDTAIRARLLLRQREVADLQRRWRADAYAGIEYDDNVTLESAEDNIPASGRDDFRGTWGAGASGRPWMNEHVTVTIGGRYDQTYHFDRRSFDVLGLTGFASGSWALNDDLALRLDGVVGNTRQDLDNELIAGSIRPNVVYSISPTWGAVRGFFQVEFFEYADDADFRQFERDGTSYAVGVEHFLPLAIPRSWLAVSFSWTRNLTQADSDGTTSGFDGDFDYDSYRARASTRLELPCEVRLEILTSYSHDRYHNDNFSYFLDNPTSPDRKRRDDILSGRLALSREIVGPLRFEVYWRGTRRISNVDLFDYDKQVAGALVRVAFE